jgi:hypothetical protein
VRADGKEKCKMKMKNDLREKMRRKRGKNKNSVLSTDGKKVFSFPGA